MAVSANISKTGFWLLLGFLGLAGAQTAACSSEFHSCYDSRTCPPKPEAEAGAAGDEAGGGSGGAGPARAGAAGSDRAGAGGVLAEAGVGGGVDGGAAGEVGEGGMPSYGTGGISSGAGGISSGTGGISSGAGGAAGSPGAVLGSSCTQSDKCASGHCSDGVCCDLACAGPCAQCSAAGKCEAPQDDPACPVVSCSTGANECLSYDTEIASNRCLSIGICKAVQNCGSSPKPAQTACNIGSSNFALCNSSGTCTAPVVKCGSMDCAIGSKVCCFRRTGSTTSQTCDDVANCVETPPAAEPARTPTQCDEHTDCRTGYLCSRLSASGGSDVYCRLAAQANVSSSVANWYEVCQSSVKTNTCSGGRTCSETDVAFPGWKFCAHLATD